MPFPRHSALRGWSILSALSLPTLLAAAVGIPPDKEVITLTPKFGPVTFAHRPHSELEGVTCTTCHHMREASGGEIVSCYSCHPARYFRIADIREAEAEASGDPKIPDAQEAFHGLCRGCHHHRQSRALRGGPDDSCRDCHE